MQIDPVSLHPENRVNLENPAHGLTFRFPLESGMFRLLQMCVRLAVRLRLSIGVARACPSPDLYNPRGLLSQQDVPILPNASRTFAGLVPARRWGLTAPAGLNLQ